MNQGTIAPSLSFPVVKSFGPSSLSKYTIDDLEISRWKNEGASQNGTAQKMKFDP